MKRVAIFLYEHSTQAAEPFLAAGWECHCIDLAHERTEQIGDLRKIKADAREWRPPREIIDRVRFFAAFSPCDHMAVSGARWFKGKGLRKLAWSIDLFGVAAEWAEWFEAPYILEHPVSTISTYWRPPDHTMHPWHYAGLAPEDHYTKHTCLWTGHGFRMPPMCPLETEDEPDDRIHKARPGKGRAAFRSLSPKGFMRAVYAENFALIDLL